MYVPVDVFAAPSVVLIFIPLDTKSAKSVSASALDKFVYKILPNNELVK